MTDECRPAAGAEHRSLHWLKCATNSWHYHLGEWCVTPHEYWIIGNRQYSPSTAHECEYTYHIPASPDAATERTRLEAENARLREVAKRASAYCHARADGMDRSYMLFKPLLDAVEDFEAGREIGPPECSDDE